MATAPQQTWTVEAYLDFERNSDVRHEYLNGEIFAMVGGSPNHSIISGSVNHSLYAQTQDRPCIIFNGDMRVRVHSRMYAYPDISVVCGTPHYNDSQPRSLLNPALIIEVLSDSTENYDRGVKFQHYRSLASLQEYVLISQHTPHIERYLRQPDNQWLLSDAVGLDAVLELPSIGCTLRLADVYAKVTLDDTE